jgi:hypothetical protein
MRNEAKKGMFNSMAFISSLGAYQNKAAKAKT